jgi:hypothetical protein
VVTSPYWTPVIDNGLIETNSIDIAGNSTYLILSNGLNHEFILAMATLSKEPWLKGV